MRKILSLIFLALFLPFQAKATNCDNNNNEDPTGCISYDGCFFQPAEGLAVAECRLCGVGTYNYTDSGYIQECIACPTSYTENGKIPDNTSQQQGQSDCPWICDNGYYRGGTNNEECNSCPQHANTCSQGSTTESITCETGLFQMGSFLVMNALQIQQKAVMIESVMLVIMAHPVD